MRRRRRIGRHSPNPIHYGRTKYIEIRHHFIREKVSEGLMKLTFIPTKEEAADGLTKPLQGEAFKKFIKKLGLEMVLGLFNTSQLFSLRGV